MTLIQIILIWLITILGSIGLNILKDLTTIKDVADAGYLIDFKNTSELNDKINEVSKINSRNFMLFPIINLICSLAENMTYTMHRDELIMSLNMFNCLRPMDENLKKEYEKHPTMLNALKIALKDVSNEQRIKIPTKDGKGFNEIRYQYNETKNDFDILGVKGPAENLSYREQKEMVLNAWREIGEQISYSYESLEEFGKEFENNKTIELANTKAPDIEADTAYVESIDLCHIDDNESYFQLSLVDEEGSSLGIFGSPYLTSSEDFRKETFGILSAINHMDILSLGGNKQEIPIKFKCNSRNIVNELINEDGLSFHISDDGEYITKKMQGDEREVFNGNITKITSSSDTITIQIKSEYFTTHYVSGNLYYGFGYPLLSRTNNDAIKEKSANHYKAYIENLLKFLNTDDLLRVGGEVKKSPKILIERDEVGNIIAIGSEENDYHLRIDENKYKIEKGRLIPRKKVEKKLF